MAAGAVRQAQAVASAVERVAGAERERAQMRREASAAVVEQELVLDEPRSEVVGQVEIEIPVQIDVHQL